MRKVICTEQAPKAIGSYSQAVYAGNLIFTSGQIAIAPGDSELCSDVFGEQAKQVFENLLGIARAAETDLSQVVKMTVYLKDLKYFSELNSVMEAYFSSPFPARAAIEVSRLPKDALIEIDAIIQL